MPRRDTPFVPDQYCHFYNRGNNRQAVFFERDNYLYFLLGVKKYLREYVEVLVYCLMPSRYHILVRVLGGVNKKVEEKVMKKKSLEDFGLTEASYYDSNVAMPFWLQMEMKEFLVTINHELKMQLVFSEGLLKVLAEEGVASQRVEHFEDKTTVKDVCMAINEYNAKALLLLDVMWQYARLKESDEKKK